MVNSGASLKCPRCRLFSPPGSRSCDCGYEFSAASYERDAGSYRLMHRSAGTRKMVVGVLCFVAGGGFTAISLSDPARTGGRFVFLGGLMAIGVVQFFRGVGQRWPRE